MKIRIIYMALTSSLLAALFSLEAQAGEKFTCPEKANETTFFIDGVGINIDHYQPRIHFRGQDAGSWAYLAYSQGINKDPGKAILAVALTAYSTSAQVRILCSNESVNALWISDSAGRSKN